MRTGFMVVIAAGTAAVAASALAHEGDVGVKVINGFLKVGVVVESSTDQFVQIDGTRAYGAEFNLGDGVGDEPGFFFEEDELPGGSTFGFNIRKAFRSWNGSDFGTIAAEALRIENPAGTEFATTPATDTSVEGWSFTVPGSGDFDDHPVYFLENRTGAGIYLLELEAKSNAGFENSPAFWMIFNDGGDEDQHDLAIEWVEENLVPTPGTLGFVGFFGIAAIRRRH